MYLAIIMCCDSRGILALIKSIWMHFCRLRSIVDHVYSPSEYDLNHLMSY